MLLVIVHGNYKMIKFYFFKLGLLLDLMIRDTISEAKERSIPGGPSEMCLCTA